MPRPRRQIISGEPYELCFRTKRGLPFVCTAYMNLIIRSALARAQRDNKVTLCHIVAMANHFHIILVAKDAFECTKFYCEVKKQITESLKSLLGLDSLNLWKGNGTSVVKFFSESSLIERIAYIWLTPSTAIRVLVPGMRFHYQSRL
jgi:REP element-mobilizing transposase RayT